MKLFQLLLAVAVLSPACQAGLLRVPRVYNALISTNQRLSPSRADTVSLPAVPVLGPLAVVPALVAADKANATEPAAAAGNHTAAAAAVLPLAVYSPYYYHPYHYAYHYSSPFLLPPPPLLHPYSFGYLPLAFPVPDAPPGDDKADDAPKEQPSDDDSKEAVTVKDV